MVVGGLIILFSAPFVTGSFDPALPFVAYAALIDGAFGGVDKIVHTFLTAPIVLTGLSVGIGFKAGLFNIGAGGQLLMGALGAGVVGAAVADWPPALAITAATLAAIVLGGSWGFIPGALKAFTGATKSSSRSCSTSSPRRSSRRSSPDRSTRPASPSSEPTTSGTPRTSSSSGRRVTSACSLLSAPYRSSPGC